MSCYVSVIMYLFFKRVMEGSFLTVYIIEEEYFYAFRLHFYL